MFFGFMSKIVETKSLFRAEDSVSLPDSTEAAEQ